MWEKVTCLRNLIVYGEELICRVIRNNQRLEARLGEGIANGSIAGASRRSVEIR
ncbi:MAG: hypothetical protein H6Q72_311 [Firmicutes bacterium]|nr:hypothetical protein [Bacillota bacterium]